MVVQKELETFSQALSGDKMTIENLVNNKFLIPIKNVQVTERLSQLAEEVDCPMRCDVVNIAIDSVDEEGKVYKLYLDFKPYEDFNKSVAIPCFWDKNRNPTLTWFETPYYKNGKVEVCVMGTDLFEDFFEKKTVEDLRDEFSPHQLDWISKDGLGNLVYPKGYVEFLEKKILGN